MSFSVKDFFSKYEHIRKKMRIRSHLLKKPLSENFLFCAVIFRLLQVPQMNTVLRHLSMIILLVSSSCRNSRPEVFCKKDVPRNFAKFTGKHLCQSLFFNKVTDLLKKRLWYRCFPVNFVKFLRTPILTEHHRWLLLIMLDTLEKKLKRKYFDWGCFPQIQRKQGVLSILIFEKLFICFAKAVYENQ